jgi:trypsin
MRLLRSLALLLVASTEVLATNKRDSASPSTVIESTTSTTLNSPLDTSVAIAGGEEVPSASRYPYMFALERKDPISVCGATLINSKQVITAAHCVDKKDVSQLLLRANSRHLFQGGRLFEVEKIRIHPGYFSNKWENDLAILDLRTPTSSISPVKLPKSDVPVVMGERVTILGWGLMIRNDPTSTSRVLRRARVFVDDVFKCEKIWPKISFLKNFCTEGEHHLGTGHGDSGGPVLQGDELVGVIKGGRAIHITDKRPDYHVSVGPHLDWIRWGGLNQTSSP